jgi:hypothetical protein
MTQFLLVESLSRPAARGFGAKRVVEAPYLVRAARHNFGAIDTVWVIRPDQGEVDSLVDNAVERIQNGGSYRDTELAHLLEDVTETAEGLALFCASYANDLPIAASPSELHERVENELRHADSAGAELYVRWRRA